MASVSGFLDNNQLEAAKVAFVNIGFDAATIERLHVHWVNLLHGCSG
jgi:hypothetical protein